MFMALVADRKHIPWLVAVFSVLLLGGACALLLT